MFQVQCAGNLIGSSLSLDMKKFQLFVRLSLGLSLLFLCNSDMTLFWKSKTFLLLLRLSRCDLLIIGAVIVLGVMGLALEMNAFVKKSD